MLWTQLSRALALGLIFASFAVNGAQITANLEPDPNNPQFGRLNQLDTTACRDANGNQIDGTQACGPTAAVNSFQFLENRYPDIYGGRLISQDTSDQNQNWIITGNLLGAIMECSCSNGTNITNFIQGKQTYIESKVPGQTVYMHQDVFALGDIGMSKRQGAPSFAFLLQELQLGEDVELLISYHDDQDYQDDNSTAGAINDRPFDANANVDFYGGHFVTMTGLSLTDTNNNGNFDVGEALRLMFIDPGTGAPGSANAFLNGFGFDTDYGSGAIIQGASISAIVSESPVPEPETMALLVVGLLGLAGVKARRAA